MFTHLPFRRLVRVAALGALMTLFATSLLAQAQFAGTYFGTLNTRVGAGGFFVESSFGAYIATVSATGAFNLNSGALTGTVNATGDVTINGGTSFNQLAITAAKIENNQLSSAYGALVANGTSSYRINPSTSFQSSGGGGGGGTTAPSITSATTASGTVGGAFTYQIVASGATSYGLRASASILAWLSVNTTTGLVSGTPPGAGSFEFEVEAINSAGTTRRAVTLTVAASGGGTSGDLLAYYTFNDATNLYKDDSGRGTTLVPVGGAITSVTGRVGGAMATNGVRLRAAVNNSFSVSTYTLSYFVKVQGAGNWNPRTVAVQVPGTSTHYYGSYINGATTANRQVASYHLSNRSARIYLSPASSMLATNTTSDWRHVAITHDGSTVRMFLDGENILTQANAGAVDRFSNAVLMIGGSDNGLDLFQGQFDEVRIYNRALSAAEVATLRNGGSVGSAAAGSNNAVTLAADVIAGPDNLVGYRNRVGQSFQFLLTGTPSSNVWGTDVYTDNSRLGAAAVHAGVLGVGEIKVVTVKILPGQSSYTGSTRNTITSSSASSYGGSYAFAGATGTTGGSIVLPSLPTGYVASALSVVPGGRFVLPITVTGSGSFTFQWFLNGLAISGATSNPYVINSVTAANAGTYTVRVTNSAGSQTFTAGTLSVPASANAPQIVLQPFDKVVAPGGTFALAASAFGSGLSYQWLRNGSPLAGETGSILLRQNVSANDAGQYAVRVTGGGTQVTTNAATVTLNPDASRLNNLSGRIEVAGEARVIPAFTIAGTGKKRVLIRAVGPTLATFGLGGTMPDPKFELYDGSRKIAENNNWDASTTQVAAAVGAFALNANSLDAAGVYELDAGKGYSIHVLSNNGQGGVVLFEVYDAGNVGGASKFTNVAVRGNTGTGAATLILGMNIVGTGKRTVLVRGVGPELAQFGLNAIPDPQLEIFDGANRSVLANDNWNAADFVSEMLQAREFVGAFPLSAGSADASTLALLDPGSYTMQITAGTGTASGEALVEIYEVP